MTLLNFKHQIFIGSGDEAYIDINDAVAADPHNLFFLNGSKEPGLQFRRNISDLIQEDRSVVCLFK